MSGSEHIWASVSTDGSQSWSWQTRVTDDAEASRWNPRIACDSLGVFYAVWWDSRGGTEPWACYFSRSTDGGETWLWPNVRISDEGRESGLPAIASDPTGTRIVCLFRDTARNVIYSSYSDNSGSTWSSDVLVSDQNGYSSDPAIAWAYDQVFIAAWYEGAVSDTCHIQASYTLDGGESWHQPPIPVPDDGLGFDFETLRLTSSASCIHATWITHWQKSEWAVFYSRSDDAGQTWLSEPVRVDTDGVHRCHWGGIWAQSSDTVYVAWNERDIAYYPAYAVCSRSIDGGQTWEKPVAANPLTAQCDRCVITGDRALSEVYMCWINGIDQHVYSAIGSDELGIEGQSSVRFVSGELLVYPNPAAGTVTIVGSNIPQGGLLLVTDITGRLIDELELPGDGSSIAWDITGLTPGIYLIRTEGEPVLSGKAVVLP